MPQPHLRTRSKKRLKASLPGGRNQIHYKKGSTATPSCYICGKLLAGIEHLSLVETNKLNRSKRRIYRPYGGKICSNCLKNALKQASRAV